MNNEQLTTNEQITYLVLKWLKDTGTKHKHLIGMMGISAPSFHRKLNNQVQWRSKDVELLKQMSIIKITVK